MYLFDRKMEEVDIPIKVLQAFLSKGKKIINTYFDLFEVFKQEQHPY